MKYDKPLIAAIIGAVSTVPSEVLTRLLLLFGIGKYSIYQLDSLLITFNRPTTIIGLIVNFIVGGFVGIVFYYSLEKIGTDYLTIKSASVGALLWVFFELMFTLTVEGEYIDIRPISDYYVHIFGSLVYGITLGLLFKKYLLQMPLT
ncbi:hypothetical protein [Desulfosporosinus fructosivorans]